MASRASGSSLDSLLETSHNQLVAMQSLVAVVSDAQFIAHHKKVARTIHDHLSEHLGSTSQCIFFVFSLCRFKLPTGVYNNFTFLYYAKIFLWLF